MKQKIQVVQSYVKENWEDKIIMIQNGMDGVVEFCIIALVVTVFRIILFGSYPYVNLYNKIEIVETMVSTFLIDFLCKLLEDNEICITGCIVMKIIKIVVWVLIFYHVIL